MTCIYTTSCELMGPCKCWIFFLKKVSRVGSVVASCNILIVPTGFLLHHHQELHNASPKTLLELLQHNSNYLTCEQGNIEPHTWVFFCFALAKNKKKKTLIVESSSPPSPCLVLLLCIVLCKFSSKVFALPLMWSYSYAFFYAGYWSASMNTR